MIDPSELLALDEADKLAELIEGVMVTKMPTQFHALIAGRLYFYLMLYLNEHPIGWVLPDARYKLPEDEQNAYIPDVSFVSHDKGALVKRGAAPYMPDLAIEVQSPDQSDKFMSDKAAYYLAHGSRMVWLVYPDRRLIEVLTPDSRQLITESGILEGGTVLPEFRLEVRQLFPEGAD